MTNALSAEFARLRAAICAETSDWTEIRLVFQLLEAHAITPAMHEALDNLMTTPDRAGLKLAVDRLEAAFAGTTSRS